jgi:hypothetical protein
MPKATNQRPRAKAKKQPADAKKGRPDGSLPPIRIAIDSNLFAGEDTPLARNQKKMLEAFGCRKKGEAGTGLCYWLKEEAIDRCEASFGLPVALVAGCPYLNWKLREQAELNESDSLQE